MPRLTHDGTLAQSLIDSGQLTEEEAESLPQRATLIGAPHGGTASTPSPATGTCCTRTAHTPSSRSLQIHSTSSLSQPPAAVVDGLVTLVRDAGARGTGAPDNVTCVMTDALPTRR